MNDVQGADSLEKRKSIGTMSAIGGKGGISSWATRLPLLTLAV